MVVGAVGFVLCLRGGRSLVKLGGARTLKPNIGFPKELRPFAKEGGAEMVLLGDVDGKLVMITKEMGDDLRSFMNAEGHVIHTTRAERVNVWRLEAFWKKGGRGRPVRPVRSEQLLRWVAQLEKSDLSVLFVLHEIGQSSVVMQEEVQRLLDSVDDTVCAHMMRYKGGALMREACLSKYGVDLAVDTVFFQEAGGVQVVKRGRTGEREQLERVEKEKEKEEEEGKKTKLRQAKIALERVRREEEEGKKAEKEKEEEKKEAERVELQTATDKLEKQEKHLLRGAAERR